MHAISDFCPNNAEADVGLALQDDTGRYFFFLAGTRYRCPPGQLLYAGIGGHREGGEDWLACAHREAREEVGTDVEIKIETCRVFRNLTRMQQDSGGDKE